MPEFEPDERNLILLYNTGSREGLMKELNEMMPYMEKDQDTLRGIAHSVVEKLERMTDADFDVFCAKLEPTF